MKHVSIGCITNILCLASNSLQMLSEGAGTSLTHIPFGQTSARVVSVSAAAAAAAHIVSASSGKVVGNGRTQTRTFIYPPKSKLSSVTQREKGCHVPGPLVATFDSVILAQTAM
jgi:hypothetical protein